jgi:hypothetical protein
MTAHLLRAVVDPVAELGEVGIGEPNSENLRTGRKMDAPRSSGRKRKPSAALLEAAGESAPPAAQRVKSERYSDDDDEDEDDDEEEGDEDRDGHDPSRRPVAGSG